ncbi:hypothetical protein CR162_16810 [Pseudoroseomonas rhizosphaerae]|uniref:Polysaccharide pyruvyl transferase domain-containing protein n=1 Tax=Teichococcus rhizosphaerae TaxID=1335062 RepID=A0A2C7A153_9PROT|nr:hypothetical protein [Pseudoroseomonas rhizosphaerae]PHK93778.1 hypothetical protein CR162_16810 [Pseudoroseomonas rhizosphaerae]
MTAFSPHLDLDDAIRRNRECVPLGWVRSVNNGPANLGDASSAVVVATMSGLQPLPANFNDLGVRMTAVGTIGQDLRFGTLHIWGTGFDAGRRAFGRRDAAFAAAPATNYVVHAVRGPHTRRTLLDCGILAPPIYGDAAWFLPRIFPAPALKQYELGVIAHISELSDESLGAGPRFPRYATGLGDGVRIISTRHEASLRGFRAKLDQILSCRRIVSLSFHGKLIADCYGIPNLYFPRDTGGPLELGLDDPRVNHRFADFYAGCGLRKLPAFGQPAQTATAWDRVMDAVDRMWQPAGNPMERVFFDAFPLTPKVSMDDAAWALPEGLLDSLQW